MHRKGAVDAIDSADRLRLAIKIDMREGKKQGKTDTLKRRG
jgi:hypothetical protein